MRFGFVSSSGCGSSSLAGDVDDALKRLDCTLPRTASSLHLRETLGTLAFVFVFVLRSMAAV